MARRAHAVARAEQALDGGHPVVAPLPFGRSQILRPRNPDAAAARMAAEQVRLGRHELGDGALGADVHARPDAGLPDAHVEEVFPRLGFQVLDLLRCHRLGQLRHGGRRIHQDRPAAFLHLLEHRVVAQAARHDVGLVVRRELRELAGMLGHVVLAEAVGRLRLEQQEPRADRAVAVLEARRHEAVFHHREFGADLGRHRIRGARVPHRIPDASHALAGGARPEHVDGTARNVEDRLGLDHVQLVLAHAKSRPRRRSGSARWRRAGA